MPVTLSTHEAVRQQLIDRGVDVRSFRVSLDDFHAYVAAARYDRHRGYYGGGRHSNFVEKALEHHLAAVLLDLRLGQRYLDVASGESPSPRIYERLFGVAAYRQDLAYARGVHGRSIGGDATSLPLPDSSVDSMALHCSFEHLEGDRDTRFLAEASRVLKPGGRLCILPLYFFTHSAVQTDPSAPNWTPRIFEPDVPVYCRAGWKNRFARYYDAQAFEDRCLPRDSQMTLTIYWVENEKEVFPRAYVKFAALFEKAARGHTAGSGSSARGTDDLAANNLR